MGTCRVLILFFIALLARGLEAQLLKCSPRAKAAIVFNPDTGAILFEKRAYEPHYPASILKIASVMAVLDQRECDLKKICSPSPASLEVVQAEVKQGDFMKYPSYLLEHDSVLLGLQEKKQYTLGSLLYAMIHLSGNDASNVVAENVGGTIENFMKQLNNKLREIGAMQTQFQNPHGLHHPAQMTTAYDMALIGRWAFNNPKFVEIAGAQSYDDNAYDIPIKNRNPLIKRTSKYYYPKAIGGKTGYIGLAGYNLVACAEDKGRRLLVVLLGCTSSAERSEDAIALFETAFQEKGESRTLFTKNEDRFVRHIEGSERHFSAHLQEDVVIRQYPSEKFAIETDVVWKDIPKRVLPGEQVGELLVRASTGTCLCTVPLIADHAFTMGKMHYSFFGVICLATILLIGAFVLVQKRKKGAKLFQ